MKRLSLLGAFLMLLSLAAKSDYYRFVESQVVKNGVIYCFGGVYRDGEGEENTAYAYVYGLTDDFTGTNLVIEDSVLVELTKSSGGGGFIEAPRRTGADNITVNIPVKDLYFNDYITEVTSLTLPKTITGEELINNRLSYLKNLEEIIVEDDNEKYSSNHGLLCNAAGDSLLYIPKKSYQIDGDCLTVPMGIHYDVTYKSWEVSYPDYFYINRIHYKDELSAWPIYSCDEMWLENNQTPPENMPQNGYSLILYVPSGCASIYAEKIQTKYIVEIGGNVDWIGKSYTNDNGRNAYYDVNDDGELEVLHSGNNDSSGYYRMMKRDESITDYVILPSGSYGIREIFQDPQRDDLILYDNNGTEEFYRKNMEGNYERIVGQRYIDVDGDGLRDFPCVPYYWDEDWKTYFQQSDGSLLETAQHSTIIEPSDAVSSTSRLPSLRDGMFLGDEPASSSSQVITGKDFRKDVDTNNDGLIDFIGNKGIQYSDGENQYVMLKTETRVWTYDIDGDGDMDMVTFGDGIVKLITKRSSNAPVETELFRNIGAGNPIFRDFDKDGDIDILFSYSVNGNNEYTNYFVFLRNNGNGTFRKKESNISGPLYRLQACGDYDGDGLYELLVDEPSYINESYSKGVLLKVNSNFTITEYPEEFSIAGTAGGYWKSPALGDFNNDGLTEWYSNKGAWYGHLKTQTIRNTAPQKMEMPTAVLQPENNRLKITWKQGHDQETSACDLTYELRIGTAPGLGDIMRPASLEDGRRKTLREGEMGTALYKLFNAKALKPGTYYIAVQAIDAGGLGGAFSDEFVYELLPAAPSFSANLLSLSTGDTLIVSIKAPVADATYEWTLSEGEVLKQTEKGAEIQFHEMGEHTVYLTMTLDGVAYKSDPQSFYVDAAKSDNYIKGTVFDINQDGYADALYKTTRWYDGLGWENPLVAFQNDGNGNMVEIKLSVFSDLLDASVLYVTDYDRDGYPDMILNGTDKGNLFLNYGEQDFDFDYQTIDFKYNTITPYGNLTTTKYAVDCADLNNDGHDDIINGSNVCVNSGDDVTYDELEFTSGNDKNIFYDVNRDGFLDIVKLEKNQYVNDNGEWDCEFIWTIYYNDNSESPTYSQKQTLFYIDGYSKYDMSSIESYQLGDLNNDGIVDLIYYHYLDSALYVVKGIKDRVAVETIKIPLPFEMNSNQSLTLRDINNDGFIDICLLSTYITHTHHVVIMKANFNYEMHPTVDFDGITWMVFKDGGYPGGLSGTIKNAKPSAPATVAAKQTADGLLITWADAADDHTPAVQMRYNISVKRKGKTGPGAYIISPMNGESDVATIVSNYLYKQSTQMLIPASVLTAGETYEIRVQAIDLWNEVSPMTKSIEFTMGGGGYIDMTERVATNKGTTVKYVGTQASSYTIDAGQDGTIVNTLGNGQYVISWSTPGVKQISITAGSTTVTSSVTVVNPIALDFSVPATVFAGAPLSISLNPEMAAETIGTGLRCDDKSVTIDYASGGETAMVTFSEPGSYTLEAYSEDEVRGGTYQCVVNVGEMMPEAVIQRVDVTGNNYYVQWDNTSLPAAITEVIVLREGNSLNHFIVMDTVSVADGYYVDASSNALVVSNRYGIILKADNGQTSAMSVVHKPLHVMLSNSSMGGYNLMWNSYEGLVVDNYQVWRGSTPESMALYEQVASSQQSYTDLSPLPGTSYYTIVLNPQHPMASMRRASVNADGNVRSNYVSTSNATSLILAESIEITNGTDIVLTEVNPDIRLYCTILPIYYTVSDVSWNIVEGADIATIDNDGRLHVTGSGQVKVRATTLDGSNLSAEATITSQFSEFKPGDVNGDGDVDIADAVCIVNHVVDKPNTAFIEAAADANGDGDIDIADAVHIVNLVVGKITALAPRFEWNLPEPE